MMWERIAFRTEEQFERWVEKNGHRYQWEVSRTCDLRPVVEYRPFRVVIDWGEDDD